MFYPLNLQWQYETPRFHVVCMCKHVEVFQQGLVVTHDAIVAINNTIIKQSFLFWIWSGDIRLASCESQSYRATYSPTIPFFSILSEYAFFYIISIE